MYGPQYPTAKEGGQNHQLPVASPVRAARVPCCAVLGLLHPAVESKLIPTIQAVLLLACGPHELCRDQSPQQRKNVCILKPKCWGERYDRCSVCRCPQSSSMLHYRQRVLVPLLVGEDQSVAVSVGTHWCWQMWQNLHDILPCNRLAQGPHLHPLRGTMHRRHGIGPQSQSYFSTTQHVLELCIHCAAHG